MPSAEDGHNMSRVTEAEIILLASQIRNTIINAAKPKKTKIDSLINKAQDKLGLTLIPVVVDATSSSLLSWGRNDDPSPGTLEQLVLTEYKVQEGFKHRQLAIGIMNELKTSKLYVSINYVQRTLFISSI